MKGKGLKFKLIALLVLLFVIGVALISIGSTQVVRKNMGDLYSNLSYGITSEVARSMDLYFVKYEGMLNSIANTSAFKEMIKEADGAHSLSQAEKIIGDHLRESEAQYNELPKNSLYFGSPVYKRFINLPSEKDPTQRPWYILAVKEDKLSWTATYIDIATGNPCITVAVPVKEGNSLLGVLGLDLFLTDLANMATNYSIGDTGKIQLVDTVENTVIAHENFELVGEPAEPEILDKINQGADKFFMNYQGSRRLFSIKRLSNVDIAVVSYVTEGEVYTPARNAIFMNSIIGLIVLLIISFVAAIWMNRFVKNISSISNKMTEVSKGDFTQRVDVNSDDELGSLQACFNEMTEKVSDFVKATNNVSESVLGSAQNLAAISEEVTASSSTVLEDVENIAEGAKIQEDESRITLDHANELADGFESLNSYSRDVSEKIQNALKVNEESKLLFQDLKHKNESSASSNAEIEKAVTQVDASMNSITGILETINSIASQTNLLALNASIEAARAGDAGRGFAVVADEIRKLAEETDSATNEISDIINRTSEESKQSVRVMNDLKESFGEQSSAMESVEDIFNEISTSIQESGDSVANITEMISKLDKIKEEINSMVKKISEISNSTADATSNISGKIGNQSKAIEQVAHHSISLSETIEELHEMLGFFKVE